MQTLGQVQQTWDATAQCKTATCPQKISRTAFSQLETKISSQAVARAALILRLLTSPPSMMRGRERRETTERLLKICTENMQGLENAPLRADSGRQP